MFRTKSKLVSLENNICAAVVIHKSDTGLQHPSILHPGT